MMDNLALNKPALQSSVSAWSSSSVAAEAARGGNDGDLSRDLGIHTERERDPWWQVDLQGTYAAEQVHLFNRDAFPERLSRFSVLGSLDGIVWDILASKSDNEVFGPDGEPFVLDLPRRPVLRFLRVRLDGLSCLHFKECRVFGVEAAPDLVIPEDTITGHPKRIVFSALYNESDAFLDAYLANFLHHTGAESVLLVNFPPGRTIPDNLPGDRVVVFNGDTRRHKSGHTLLMGHLESYALALQRFGEFDYFCPLASNSLFVRRFDPAAAVRQLRAGHKVPIDLDITYDVGLDIDRLPDNWHWPKIGGNRPFMTFLKERWGIDRLSQNQIEGLMASRADWGLLHARLPEFPSMGDLVLQEESAFLPLEEILPSTFFLAFGSGRYVNICHVFWNRFNHTGSGRVTIDELLGFSRYPAHLCLMKWFERDVHAVETAAVTQLWSQTLLAGLATTSHGAGEQLLQRLLLENLASSLRVQEVAIPFSAGWQSSPEHVLPPCVFHDPRLSAVRQTMHLPTTLNGHEASSDAYLYLDYTQHEIDLSLQIVHEATTRVHLACNRLDVTPEDRVVPVLEGFLYMRAVWRGDTPIVRMRVPSSQAERSMVMRSIVVMCDGNYTRVTPLHLEPHEEVTDYYFSATHLLTGESFWFGIPFFADLRFEAELTLIQAGLSGVQALSGLENGAQAR